MACLIPVHVFLEARLDVIPYLLLLVVVVAAGLALFFRGRGWSEWP
jgi:hypothetical protein